MTVRVSGPWRAGLHGWRCEYPSTTCIQSFTRVFPDGTGPGRIRRWFGGLFLGETWTRIETVED